MPILFPILKLYNQIFITHLGNELDHKSGFFAVIRPHPHSALVGELLHNAHPHIGRFPFADLAYLQIIRLSLLRHIHIAVKMEPHLWHTIAPNPLALFCIDIRDPEISIAELC